MNPTLPEEAGQTGRAFLEAMKSQPALLGMIIANIAMLVFVFYALTEAAGFRNTMIAGQLDYQKHVTELLSKCVVP